MTSSWVAAARVGSRSDLDGSMAALVMFSTIQSSVAAIISTSLAKPFQVAVIAVIYFDLRVRKEGFDLQLLADRIGGTTYADVPSAPSHSTLRSGNRSRHP